MLLSVGLLGVGLGQHGRRFSQLSEGAYPSRGYPLPGARSELIRRGGGPLSTVCSEELHLPSRRRSVEVLTQITVHAIYCYIDTVKGDRQTCQITLFKQ